MRRPLRPCGHPGCSALVRGASYCDKHQKPRAPDPRPSAARRGYGAKWTRYSEAYRRAHPWCRTCEQAHRQTPTAVVDHIEPVSGPSDAKFWDPSNHQPLCLSCHGRKTKAEGKTARSEPEGKPPRIDWYFA